MDYLIVYSGDRPPEQLIGPEDTDELAVVKRYLAWVQCGICRVFRFTINDLDLATWELAADGEFQEVRKEFL
jgi:hypothetical protein